MDRRSLGDFRDDQYVLTYKDKAGFNLLSIGLKSGENKFLRAIPGSEIFNLTSMLPTKERTCVLSAGGKLRIFKAGTGEAIGQISD